LVYIPSFQINFSIHEIQIIDAIEYNLLVDTKISEKRIIETAVDFSVAKISSVLVQALKRVLPLVIRAGWDIVVWRCEMYVNNG
jgi:hypothetical protein